MFRHIRGKIMHLVALGESAYELLSMGLMERSFGSSMLLLGMDVASVFLSSNLVMSSMK